MREGSRDVVGTCRMDVRVDTERGRVQCQSVFFGGDTLRIAELDEVARRYPAIDVALLPVNGLAVRPALNRRVLMTAEHAAEFAGVLRPRVAVLIHYRYTAGPVRDRLLPKYDGTPERFAAALATEAPATQARILEPGQPLTIDAAAPGAPDATQG